MLFRSDVSSDQLDALVYGDPFLVIDDLLAEPGLETLTNVLLYHVLDGRRTALNLYFSSTATTLQGSDVSIGYKKGSLLINDARVISPNGKTPTGLVHIIDTVLLPSEQPEDLIDLLEEDGRFTVLLTALNATGLEDAVREGGLTVFAPTDDAFAALPPELIEALLLPENSDALTEILTYHVVSGEVLAADVAAGEVATVQGEEITIAVDDGIHVDAFGETSHPHIYAAGDVARFPDPASLAAAEPLEVEEIIRSTGFFRNKARAIIGCGRELTERFQGRVPEGIEELVSLPGVGRKTGNIVRACAFGIPAIGVDTHVKRVVNRLGLVNETDPVKIERALQSLYPEDRWAGISMRFIQFGRDTCDARKPRCWECPLRDRCPYPDKTPRP